MSSISAVQRIPYGAYGRIASGKRVQNAAHGAADLSIIQKQDQQSRGYRAGSGNIKAGQAMINIADGAMGSITDSLQRMRELALQAANTAVVTDSDRANIQKEIDQLKKGIADVAGTTNYNTKPPSRFWNRTLSPAHYPKHSGQNRPSHQNMHIATDGNGGEKTISGADATLAALGIADFDVTGDFDLNVLDNALAKVSGSRSEMGAQYNALGSAYNYNAGAFINSTAGKGRLEDLDIGKAVSELKKNQTLQDYMTYMQRRQMEEQEKQMRGWFM